MNENIYTFPAIKGIQAGTEYFVSMVPLSVVPKLFSFSGNDLPAEMRSQRILNKSRIPEMKKYILDNPDSYVFSSLTVSVDGPIEFTPVNSSTDNTLGTISIPMSARLLLNDGQHRKAAIEAALQEKQSLRFETISIVFFHDLGLEKSQQMFSDLNRYAIRPTKSINVLFDSRDRLAVELCEIIEELPFFRGWVEKEKSTLANRSKALYTLSGLYHGTEALINGLNLDDYIYPGQTILIPKKNVSYYITKDGDTLNELSGVFEKDLSDIVNQNETIYLLPGQMIYYKKD